MRASSRASTSTAIRIPGRRVARWRRCRRSRDATRSLLQPGAVDPHHIGYGESIDLHLAFGSSVLRFVREGDWKYVHKVNPQLFDLGSDPSETHNLASEEPGRVEAMRARLHALLDDAPDVSNAHLDPDAEILDRLAALGYAETGTTASEGALASLDLTGPDPVGLIGDAERMGLGWGEMRLERYERAAEIFGALLADHPDSVHAIHGLVNALTSSGRGEETIPLLRQAIEIAPSDMRFYGALGMAYLKRGDAEEAERVLRAATEVDDCASESRLLLAALLSLQGRHAEQVAVLRAGLDACEDPSPLWNDAAYALATVPESGLRDGPRAVELARRAAAGSGEELPNVLDTLAVAYAETGDFSRAREAARRAIALLERQGAPDGVVAPYREHLAAIEAGRAIREGS
jgi:Flp pilus assembly protein TadD